MNRHLMDSRLEEETSFCAFINKRNYGGFLPFKAMMT